MVIQKPRHLLSRFCFLLSCGIFLLLWLRFIHACPIRAVTGIPCPGCGISRAWFAAFQLDLRQALRFHPMFWSLIPGCILFLWDGMLFSDRRINLALGICLILGLLICYAFRLQAFFAGTLIL